MKENFEQKRSPTDPRIFTKIQSLRGLSALAVVIFHAGGVIGAEKYFNIVWPSYFTHFGTNGVIVFFVLSGFIIQHVHSDDFGRPERFRLYAAKRVLRIYPIFWVVLASVWVLFVTVGGNSITSMEKINVVAKTIFLFPQDRTVVGGTGAPVIVVAWSLQYEILFYAIMGFFILNVWLGAAAIGSLLLAWVGLKATGEFNVFPAYLNATYLVLFGIGVIAASVYARLSLSVGKQRMIICTSILAIGVLYIFDIGTSIRSDTLGRGLPITESSWVQLLLGLMVAIYIIGITNLERSRGLAASRQLQILGDWSYALYLVHFPVISVVAKCVLFLGIGGLFGAIATLIFAMIGSLVLAAVLHIFVERPAMRCVRLLSSS